MIEKFNAEDTEVTEFFLSEKPPIPQLSEAISLTAGK